VEERARRRARSRGSLPFAAEDGVDQWDSLRPGGTVPTSQWPALECDYHESQDCTLTWDGWARLTSLEPLVETLLRDGVTGDFAEVGVFRGGVTMYLQGLLLVHNETERRDLWIIDSFQGMGNLSQLRESHNAAGKKLTSYMGRTWANKLAVRDGG